MWPADLHACLCEGRGEGGGETGSGERLGEGGEGSRASHMRVCHKDLKVGKITTE